MKLGDICEVITKGTTPTSLGLKFSDAGVNFIKIESISESGNFLKEKFAYISKECHTKLSRSQLKEGDLLFSIAGVIGRTAIVTKDILPANTNQAIAIIRLKEEYKGLRELIYLYFNSPLIKIQYSKKKQGVAQLNLSLQDIKDFEILEIKKEKKDEIIRNLRLIKELILKRKQQLISIYNLAKSRFLEMFGDPILNPMGWAISHYGDEFEIMSGGTPKTDIPEYWVNGKISWIGSNLCQNSVLIENDGKFITEKGLNNSSAKIFNKGYILIALVGATIGKVAHLKFSTSTNQNIAGINVPQNENYIPEFVFYNTQFLYPKFMDIGNSKFKMANLSFIRSLQIPIVPIKAQKKFSNFVEQLDKSKFRMKKCLKMMSFIRHL